MTLTRIRTSGTQDKRRLDVPSAAGDSPRSLRQLARELDVSASYLSQVKHGKCAASARLLSMLSKIESSEMTFNQGVAGSRPARPITS
jgi:transcriptional regulator with XRE-family HTH domain